MALTDRPAVPRLPESSPGLRAAAVPQVPASPAGLRGLVERHLRSPRRHRPGLAWPGRRWVHGSLLGRWEYGSRPGGPPGARFALAYGSLALACGTLALALGLPLAVHDLDVARTYVLSHAQGVALPSDFLNYYTAGRTLLVQPGALYVPDLEAALQRSITGQADLYAQFQNMPQVALLFVPLAWLPYGLAYLLWAILNLALLGASAWLIAPRIRRWPVWASTAVWVIAALACYAPAQLALIDGQTAFLALFGFCAWVACIERGRAAPDAAANPASGGLGRGALWLLTWAWKPQLLPILLLALVLSRATGRAVLLIGVQAAALGLVALWSGPAMLERYVALSQRAAGEYTSGQTVFGIAQALGGPSALTTAAAVVGVLLVCTAVAWLWWGGLRTDRGDLLQLAGLPLGAVLLAPRAYAYELTIWLATGWLLLRFVFAAGRAGDGWGLLSVLSLAWLSTLLITLSSGAGPPWAALAALGLLVILVGQGRWATPER
ncbi:MAG: DUF2029 domain-containing protein [Chloroflexi bacterium]|nr:DUF2029 domain-containing protein [Chloroflexota bacterium]